MAGYPFGKLQNLNSYFIPYTEINSKWTIDSLMANFTCQLDWAAQIFGQPVSSACFSEDVLDMINIKISKLSKADSPNQSKAWIQKYLILPWVRKDSFYFLPLSWDIDFVLPLHLTETSALPGSPACQLTLEDPETCQLPCFQELIPYNKSLPIKMQLYLLLILFLCRTLIWKKQNSFSSLKDNMVDWMLASPKCPCPNLELVNMLPYMITDITDEIALWILRYGYVPEYPVGFTWLERPF